MSILDALTLGPASRLGQFLIEGSMSSNRENFWIITHKITAVGFRGSEKHQILLDILFLFEGFSNLPCSVLIKPNLVFHL